MTYKNGLLGLVLSLVLLGACGPETIFLRPELGTPAQHVKNGHTFLAWGKIDSASAEFLRAKSLDPAYVPAYVGIALVQAHRGDVAGGLETLTQAQALSVTPDDFQSVEQGYEQIQGMQLH